jgi:hypothetical protein
MFENFQDDLFDFSAVAAVGFKKKLNRSFEIKNGSAFALKRDHLMGSRAVHYYLEVILRMTL